MPCWKAEVTVENVPTLTEGDVEAVHTVIPGVLRHEAATGKLFLTWRFSKDSPYTQDAICHASIQWRGALRYVQDADPVCTDFRVSRVESL